MNELLQAFLQNQIDVLCNTNEEYKEIVDSLLLENETLQDMVKQRDEEKMKMEIELRTLHKMIESETIECCEDDCLDDEIDYEGEMLETLDELREFDVNIQSFKSSLEELEQKLGEHEMLNEFLQYLSFILQNINAEDLTEKQIKELALDIAPMFGIDLEKLDIQIRMEGL